MHALADPVRVRIRWLSKASLVAVATFAAAVVALHALRPDYDPAFRFVSEYALGAHGGWLSFGLFVAGLGLLALGTALWSVRDAGRMGLVVPALLLMAGLGILVASLFTTDPSSVGSAVTVRGRIHSAAIDLAMPAIVGAAVVFPIWSARDPSWTALRPALIALGAFALLVFLALPLLEDVLGGRFGIGQRMLLATTGAWTILVSWRLLRLDEPVDRAPGTPSTGPVR